MSDRPPRVDRRIHGSNGLLPRLLVVLMVIAVAVNISQFTGIDEETRHNYRAIHRYDTGDVFEVAISHDISSRRRVAPFHYFGVLFPESTVIMPQSGISIWFPFETSMVAFGRVSSLERWEYDPVELVDLASIDAYRVPTASFAPASGPTVEIMDERVGYYVADDPSGVFIVVTPEGEPGRAGPLAFVDLALLDDHVAGEIEP